MSQRNEIDTRRSIKKSMLYCADLAQRAYTSDSKSEFKLFRLSSSHGEGEKYVFVAESQIDVHSYKVEQFLITELPFKTTHKTTTFQDKKCGAPDERWIRTNDINSQFLKQLVDMYERADSPMLKYRVAMEAWKVRCRLQIDEAKFLSCDFPEALRPRP